MLDLEQIEKFYTENVKVFKRNILREYLQYKILEIIFDSNEGSKISFMGGTAIRIIHSNGRFSEDLDFDNRGIDKKNFLKLAEKIKKRLELEGYKVELKNSTDGVFRSYIKIKEVLYKYGLSQHPAEKLTIQLDMEPQDFEYNPDKKIINKFDIFIRSNIVPPDILLAQKITAIFTRPRAMGRDFYDTVFLLGLTKPSIKYLKDKLGISGYGELKKKLIQKTKNLDFKKLAEDIEPFLINPGDKKRVLLFKEYIEESIGREQ
ncbi:nucleotidyl transferase AbiEii/AbiGii toxin family protein [candidate division WOR-3 bacterium]|nr:nucleotidyl transferase AbiEii/AbiGii toxin family protein [candidate division WOR-3 bacterium]